MSTLMCLGAISRKTRRILIFHARSSGEHNQAGKRGYQVAGQWLLLPNLKKWEDNKSDETLDKIKQALSDLATIDKHYARKETSLFH